MATASSPALRDLLECAICQDTVTDPLVLLCQHSFCTSCLERLFSYNRGGSDINCPTCRKPTPITGGNVKALPVDFKLKNLAEVVRKQDEELSSLAADHEHVEPENASGSNNPVEDDFLVEICYNFMRMPGNNENDVLRLSGGNEEKKCSKHPWRPSNRFCEDCQELVCGLCVLLRHGGEDHRVRNLHEFIQEYKDTIKSMETQLKRELSNEVANSEDSLQNTIYEIEKATEDTKRQIQEHTEKIIRNIKRQSEELVERVNSKHEMVVDQIITANLRRQETQSLIEKCQRFPTSEDPAIIRTEFTDLSAEVFSMIESQSSSVEILPAIETPSSSEESKIVYKGFTPGGSSVVFGSLNGVPLEDL